jgi:hypothetical protein
MIEKFLADSIYFDITRVVYEKETKHYFVRGECQRPKETSSIKHFDAIAEAREFLLQKLSDRLISLSREVDRCELLRIKINEITKAKELK